MFVYVLVFIIIHLFSEYLHQYKLFLYHFTNQLIYVYIYVYKHTHILGTLRVWDMADYCVLATCLPRPQQERGVTPQCLAYSDILLSGWSDGKLVFMHL